MDELVRWFCDQRGVALPAGRKFKALVHSWESIFSGLSTEEVQMVLEGWVHGPWPKPGQLRHQISTRPPRSQGFKLHRVSGPPASPATLKRWPEILEKAKRDMDGVVVHERVQAVEIWWRPCRVFVQEEHLIVDPRVRYGRRIDDKVWRLVAGVLLQETFALSLRADGKSALDHSQAVRSFIYRNLLILAEIRRCAEVRMALILPE